MEGYVATIGMFDGVHKGHQFVLRQVVACAQQHRLYPLCITFDHSPRCEQMLTPLNEKLRLIRLTGIEHIEVLHFTEALKQLTAREFMEQMLLKQLHVKMLLTGYDNRFGHNRNEGFDDYVRYGHELGIEVRALPAEGTVSSSHVRKLLQEGLVSEAAECLGHSYRISGIVTHGGVASHIGEGAQIDALPKVGAQEPACPEAAVALGLLLFVGHVLQEVGNGGIGILHAHQGGGYRLLGLKVFIDDEDGSLAGIYEGLVLGIGKEAERARLAMFDLGELGGSGVLVSFNRSFQ